jgi:protein SCO1
MFLRVLKHASRAHLSLSTYNTIPKTLIQPPIRIFSDSRKQEEETKNKIMDELKSGPIETKTMPALFYGVCGLLLFIMVYLQFLLKNPKKDSKKPLIKITGVAKIGGNWAALNKKGELVTNKDYNGYYTVYYFGFTKCPDVCPASLQKLSQAINLLKENKNIRYLFISLDAERDTPELVEKYAKIFHEDIEPLVVREEDLTEFLKTFKLYSRKVINESDYMLDHTTYMYLFDKSGTFVNVLGSNLNHEELAETILDHIKELENK